MLDYVLTHIPRWLAQTGQWIIIIYTLHTGVLNPGGGPGGISVGGGILTGHNPGPMVTAH